METQKQEFMFKRDWFGEGFRTRIPTLIFIFLMLSLYFPINRYLNDKGGFVAHLDSIDGNMPLLPVFVIPYVLGFGMIGLMPIYAAWKFPRQLFQQYMTALFTIMVIGFTIWIVLPAYVVKEPVVGDGFFRELNRMVHNNDSTYGTHNAIPSSHVYYVTIGMCYYLLYNRRLAVPLAAFAVMNALSTMFTHQHYFLDVVAGFLLTIPVYELTQHVTVPYLQKLEQQYGRRKDKTLSTTAHHSTD